MSTEFFPTVFIPWNEMRSWNPPKFIHRNETSRLGPHDRVVSFDIDQEVYVHAWRTREPMGEVPNGTFFEIFNPSYGKGERILVAIARYFCCEIVTELGETLDLKTGEWDKGPAGNWDDANRKAATLARWGSEEGRRKHPGKAV